MKNKVVVELCDKEYTLITDESEEYVKEIASQINKVIYDAVYTKNFRSSKTDAALLACMDLCDRNRKLSDANDNMRAQISSYIDEIASLNKRLMVYERQKNPNKKDKQVNMEIADE